MLRPGRRRRADTPFGLAALVLASSALAALISPAPLAAQRRPVLQQISVPHDYYYRELYLPQVTSGPGAATWSPDGRELVYAMQGTLWRQTVGSGVAQQLTDGPGYDAQPDWSPDGRWIVYTAYDGNAMELRLLDLERGESRPLTADGAAALEPRWSPDGSRIAFVSTAFNRRWHIFVAALSNGVLTSVDRVSDDHDSGLPRYYYSAWDHYLSPTWSPAGTELLYVGNRGHVWGTGGIWRAPIGAAGVRGLAGREVRDEETSWRARPDWARDGRRVVYASYAGGQRHQLWLMTAEGKNPLQLTYGDIDATDPRWSPAGRRIAFLSNATGNMTLKILELPGGRISDVVARDRRYRAPAGTLRIEVTDAATGAAVAARVSVTGADGRAYAPDDAWRHADDSFDRSERRFEVGYFHTAGRSALTVPAGSYDVEVSHGLEYAVVRQRVVIGERAAHSLRVPLARIANLRTRGWLSGDLHVHMNYTGHYRTDPARLAFQARAEDVHVIESLVVNKEGRMPDLQWFTGRPDAVSTPATTIVHSQEFHTSWWGHVGLLGLRDHVLVPGYAAYAETGVASLVPTNADVALLARAQGALVGYVHPFDSDPVPADAAVRLTNELPVDVALGLVDYMEIVGFSDHLSTAKVWYRLLNCGFRIPAGAGTDAMTNYASLRGPVGVNRVFVKTTGPGHTAFLAGLAAGRTFATNGPLLTFTVNGMDAGADLRLPVGGARLRVHAAMTSIVPVDHLEVVSGGLVVATIPLAGDRTRASADLELPAGASGWYTLRAWSDHATAPVLDIYPFATTSPVYVTVGGAPIRSAGDARFFVAWIDRLEAAARAHSGWNTDAERTHVLEQIGRARGEFERRVGRE